MKPELQIHSITQLKKGYEVDYSLIDDNGQADVTQVISLKAIMAHAYDNAMNVWNDGETQIEDDLMTYVSENYELVIEDMILTHVAA